VDISLKKNLFWDYFGKFGSTIFSLITTSILARILSPEDYGLVGISVAINGIAGIFFNFGLYSAIIQSDELDNKQLSTVFFFNLIIALLLWGIIFYLSPILGRFFEITQIENILTITSIAFLINGLAMVPFALLTKAMRFKTLSIISMIANLISGVIGIILALKGYGVWSLVLQQLLNALFAMFGYYFKANWLPILKFRLQSINAMLRFGFYMFLSGFLDGVFTRIDVFLIGKVFTPATLGFYTRAQGLDSQIRILSSSSLLGVLFPMFSQMKHDKVELKKLFCKFFELVSFSFCFFGGFFFLNSNIIFRLLFGPQWSESAVYFQYFILVGFAYPLSSMTLSLIEAQGDSKSFFRVEIIKKILVTPTYFIAFYFGIKMYLLSYIVFCIVGTFLNVYFATFHIDIRVVDSLMILLRYFLPCIIMVLVILGLSELYTGIDIYVKAGIKAILFMACYFMYNRILQNRGLKYTIELFR
jgi:O-antigen/teichoic acid export membrane protein